MSGRDEDGGKCVFFWMGKGLAVAGHSRGWFSDLKKKTVDLHQVKLALPMFCRVGLCLMLRGGGGGWEGGVGFQR